VTENRWKIIAWKILPAPVHLLVNVKPTDSASFVMQRVKGRASSYLRKEFPELLKLPVVLHSNDNQAFGSIDKLALYS